MRISENQIYSLAMENMNESLDRLMKLNAQSSSQKKMLLPSDNPAGMATVLNLRAHNGAVNHFVENVNTAQGWLKLADNTLGEVSQTLIKIKELAQQAATQTYTREQRIAIGGQLRGLYNTLVNQANTRFAGKSIFGGHKVDQSAFEPVLRATMLDPSLNDSDVESVSGNAVSTVRMEFTETGTIGGATPLNYRYSKDGGKTWTTATLPAGQRELDFGTGKVTLRNGITATANTTKLNVRPGAQYMGDDSDGVTVKNLSNTQLSPSAAGVFSAPVHVRIDNAGTLPGPMNYSYSLDSGSTWVTGQTSSNARLSIPGGSLTLASGAGNTFGAGNQFSVSPNTADISLSVSRTQSVVVNNVGKDVFGGVYRKPGDTLLTNGLPDKPERNAFEVVGELIGAVETNDTDAIGKALSRVTQCHEHIGAANATVGAKVNLTDFVMNVLNMRKDNNNEYISNIESVDVASLMSDIEKSKFIYSNVIKTSQIIMELNMMGVM